MTQFCSLLVFRGVDRTFVVTFAKCPVGQGASDSEARLREAGACPKIALSAHRHDVFPG